MDGEESVVEAGGGDSEERAVVIGACQTEKKDGLVW